MPNLIAKVISHVGQTGARSCRSVCRGTPKFRAMVSLRNFRGFLRSIMVKLRSRPSFHVQFNAAAGSPNEFPLSYGTITILELLRNSVPVLVIGFALSRKAGFIVEKTSETGEVKSVRLHRARIAVATDQHSILGASTTMEPAKPREWTEEETKLLIELAQRKERVPAMARELGRHIASVRRRARELGLLLPQGRGERQL